MSIPIVDSRMSALETFLASIYLSNTMVLIVSYWSPQDVYSVGHTNYFLSTLMDWYKREAWNMNKFLAFWFQNPQTFQSFLCRCDAIVSGSQVIQFLDRQPALPTDLNLYIRLDGALIMAQYLESNGYVFDDDHHPPVSVENSILRISSDTNLTSTWGRSFHLPILLKTLQFVRTFNRDASDQTHIRCVQLDICTGDQHKMLFDFHSSKPDFDYEFPVKFYNNYSRSYELYNLEYSSVSVSYSDVCSSQIVPHMQCIQFRRRVQGLGTNISRTGL